jgi:hypothetical protein
MFDDNGSYQTYLTDHAKLVGFGESVPLIGVNILAIPINIVFNVALGWHINTTPSRVAYEEKLKNLFLRDGSQKSSQIEITFPELSSLFNNNNKDPQLPFFVINTTALIEDDIEHHGSRLGSSIFEFTPIQYGSDALWRHKYDGANPVDLGRAVAISGAAVDGAGIMRGPSQKTLWSLLNQDLGFYIANPNRQIWPGIRRAQRHIPFPFYYFHHHYHRDVKGTHIYLSDGGHSDNLGVFSLVRRLCKDIIIVDAEHDPTYAFGGYVRLKRALRSEINVTVDVEAIDAGESETESNKMDIFGKTWQKYAAKPVMGGTIWNLPYPGRSPKIGITYIKLAFLGDCKKIDPDIGSYYCKNWPDNKEKDKEKYNQACAGDDSFLGIPRCPFPQEPTTDQQFEPDQFKAYRKLGYLTVTNNAKFFCPLAKPSAGSADPRTIE